MNPLYDKRKSPDEPGAGEGYDPGLLLNAIMARMHLTEDAELANRLRIDRRVLGQIRERRLQISGSMLMQMQEATGITIAELRRILGDRRGRRGMACKLEQRK
jgi:plasmid maintenance system antidote protein VapI